MKPWWKLSAEEKLKRTEWFTGVSIVLLLILGLFSSWLWFLGIPVLGLLYIGTQLHIKNQIELEKRQKSPDKE